MEHDYSQDGFFELEYSELASKIFKTSLKVRETINPPEMVFVNSDFEFLITIGGHLVDNEKEYNNFILLLKKIGESFFYVVQNCGIEPKITKGFLGYPTEGYKGFSAKFPIEATFAEFTAKVDNFESPFGFFIHDFFVFGDSQKWGIYICECPTINIIGCVREEKERFAEVFQIKGNGFAKLDEFITMEYRGNSEMKQRLIENYRLL